MHPALFLVELESIAHGIRTADVMAKRSPLPVLRTGTVHPGKFLVLAAGGVGEVEEAREAAREAAAAAILGEVFLPAVHPRVLQGLHGEAGAWQGDALGILETRTVASILDFADAALKGAEVSLVYLGLADGLGGKGYALVTGEVYDVEAAMELGVERLGNPSSILSRVVIPQVDEGVRGDLLASGPFFRGSALAMGV